MRTMHVTYPGKRVCMCARGGVRRCVGSLVQHTHIYTYIHLHTSSLCASGRGGGVRWCCTTWEWVRNAALIHVWMHWVTYINVSASSWTSASRNRHYPTRKKIWCHCHQQTKTKFEGMCINESVSFDADATRNYYDKQWCHQSLLPTKKEEKGIWAHVWICHEIPGWYVKELQFSHQKTMVLRSLSNTRYKYL